MGRVAFAGFIGTAIEFHDFYIYCTAVALAFSTVFVPEGIAGSRVVQLLTYYAGFAVAFVARPVGGRERSLMAVCLRSGADTGFRPALFERLFSTQWTPSADMSSPVGLLPQRRSYASSDASSGTRTPPT